jgi:hypothetical protein
MSVRRTILETFNLERHGDGVPAFLNDLNDLNLAMRVVMGP